MKASDSAITLIKKFEGLRLTAYQCSRGKWTIGWGSTKGVHEGMVIDEKEAELRLLMDLSDIEEDLSHIIKVPLSQNQYDAIVSWAFNFGITKIKDSELINRLNSGLPNVSDQFLRWVYIQNPATMKFSKNRGLMSRRQAEKNLFDSSPLVA